ESKSKSIINESTLKIICGQRYGLIGKNGSGKSSLLKKIASYEIDKFPKHWTIHYVSQEFVAPDIPVLDFVKGCNPELEFLKEEENKISKFSEKLDQNNNDTGIIREVTPLL